MVFVVTSGGGVLGLIGYGAWVALSVALATVVNLIIEELRLQKRLEVVNAAVNHTQNMLVWWSSLSIVDRRTRKTKTNAVTTIEQAIVEQITARTDAVISVGGGADGGDDEDRSDEEEGGGKKGK